jgi:hypothetical protein
LYVLLEAEFSFTYGKQVLVRCLCCKVLLFQPQTCQPRNAWPWFSTSNAAKDVALHRMEFLVMFWCEIGAESYTLWKRFSWVYASEKRDTK